jgi:hypothetical protein
MQGVSVETSKVFLMVWKGGKALEEDNIFLGVMVASRFPARVSVRNVFI